MDRLGIIDWGIGGISIFKLVRERLGELPVTYFSDTGGTPYGRMCRTELTARLDAVLGYLTAKKHITHLVIGCNAASTAIPHLSDHGIPVVGMIEPAIELAARLKPRKLGVIGGRRTILSGVYRRGLAKRGIEARQRIAQPLSAMIEGGDTSSPSLRDAAKQIITPLRPCSHVLLACTHYPAISSVLSGLLPPGTVLIDPAVEVIDSVREWHIAPGSLPEFLTTGETEAMRSAAKTAFDFDIPSPRSITL